MRVGIFVSVFVFLAMCAASHRALAAEMTGDRLLAACSSASHSTTREQCESYIAGVLDGIDTLLTSLRLRHPGSDAYPSLYCIPQSTTSKDLVDATVDYLMAHPSTRHFGASSEILLAVEQAYPCRGT